MQTKYTKEQIQSFDWNKRDIDLAAEYDLTRERIRQLRQQLNMPKSPFHKKQKNHIEFLQNIDAFRGLSYKEIASKLNISYWTAYNLANKYLKTT